MIAADTYQRLRYLLEQARWSARQVAAELGLNVKTVRLWATRVECRRAPRPRRPCKLDAYKGDVVGLLHQQPFTAIQVLHRLREQGYTGGYSQLKAFVREVRPRRAAAFLTLHFEPGECAQVDWGSAGSVAVGSTRRRLSFFVMVLGYSRRMYVEFTLTETLEQFLACHANAFAFFGGAPRAVMLDNLKTAVLSHPRGQPAVFNPRYLDFARFHGFTIRACNVRAAHEKGRVENGVGYVRKSFLNGLGIESFAPLNPAVRVWLETVANVRVHGETKRTPQALFALEQPRLLPLPPALYDVAIVRTTRVTRRCRVHFDGNRYSAPAEYAGQRVTLRVYPDKLLIHHRERLVAEHVRVYDRNQDFENPDHVRALLQQRHRAREQHILQRFLRLSPLADGYYRQLVERRFNPRHHAQKIVALSDIYGPEKVARALADADHFQAYSCEYIANLLEQRERHLPEPGALHLTRPQDALDIDLPPTDLSLYDLPETPHETH